MWAILCCLGRALTLQLIIPKHPNPAILTDWHRTRQWIFLFNNMLLKLIKSQNYAPKTGPPWPSCQTRITYKHSLSGRHCCTCFTNIKSLNLVLLTISQGWDRVEASHSEPEARWKRQRTSGSQDGTGQGFQTGSAPWVFSFRMWQGWVLELRAPEWRHALWQLLLNHVAPFLRPNNLESFIIPVYRWERLVLKRAGNWPDLHER